MIKKINTQAVILTTYFTLAIITFTLALLYATPYYDITLWGNSELIKFYETDIQIYNKLFFNFTLAYILFGVYFIVINFKNYYVNIYNLIVGLILQIITIVSGIILIIKTKPIIQYVDNYDFSQIEKLKNYQLNTFWKNINQIFLIIMVITSVLFIVIIIFSFINNNKYKKEVLINE